MISLTRVIWDLWVNWPHSVKSTLLRHYSWYSGSFSSFATSFILLFPLMKTASKIHPFLRTVLSGRSYAPGLGCICGPSHVHKHHKITSILGKVATVLQTFPHALASRTKLNTACRHGDLNPQMRFLCLLDRISAKCCRWRAMIKPR